MGKSQGKYITTQNEFNTKYQRALHARKYNKITLERVPHGRKYNTITLEHVTYAKNITQFR